MHKKRKKKSRLKKNLAENQAHSREKGLIEDRIHIYTQITIPNYELKQKT